jgi:hypothetical protein
VSGIEQLIGDMKENLERQMEAGFRRLGEKYDAQAARMDRQGGLIRTGQTNIVRLNEWSEKMDQLLAVRDKRIDELEARLAKLEKSQ